MTLALAVSTILPFAFFRLESSQVTGFCTFSCPAEGVGVGSDSDSVVGSGDSIPKSGTASPAKVPPLLVVVVVVVIVVPSVLRSLVVVVVERVGFWSAGMVIGGGGVASSLPEGAASCKAAS